MSRQKSFETKSAAWLWLLFLLMAVVLTLAACGAPSYKSAASAGNGSHTRGTGTDNTTADGVAVNRSGGNGAGKEAAPALSAADDVDVRQVRRALTEQEAASYLGDAVCGACHKTAAKAHNLSRHAHTLRAVTLTQDGSNFRTTQAITDASLHYTYTLAVAKGKCVLRGRNARGQGDLSADYVMGSGHNAYTYLNRDDSKGWVELRVSYYPKSHRWDYTPSQLPGTQLSRAAGRVQSKAMLTSCLLCHTTVLRATSQTIPTANPTNMSQTSANGLLDASGDDPMPDIAASRLGVGCERCHGPGRAHVKLVTQAGRAAFSPSDSARSGQHNAYGMEDLHRASPERINTICGYCHRTAENAPESDPHTETNISRFQGVALSRSACYQKSGALSCLTCHDAHSNANPSLSRNDAICLRCHTTAAGDHSNVQTASQMAASAVQRVPGKVCPINTHSGCTTCHMPKASGIMPYSLFTNHWIKVWPSGSQQSSKFSPDQRKKF